ncbi:T-cell immunoglobulin and mucin domain-containing protein 4 isoform X1 [Anguilla anguilla]|uniref:T-cell immunoglobulin and mucin domain-containing protein 4 isoform X1 n=1 Tax=Anguilla anguilla TaxID=7936 RepID=UPI0015B00840|nr:T-cell immunoglobulin and mucin domain-containing protein 4 isoform X1 [Anguilla anguilla]
MVNTLLAEPRTRRSRPARTPSAPRVASPSLPPTPVGMAAGTRLLHLRWILAFSLAAAGAAVSALEVLEGGSVSLSCRYSVKRYGLSRVCWGRSCGTLWCGDIIAQTDGEGVVSKVSDRYRVVGDVLAGQVDLVIPRVKQADKGPYCCRVDIDGYFNDKKVSYTLRVVKAPVVTTVPVPKCATSPQTPAVTESVWEEEQSNVDTSKLNSSLSKSGTVEEKPIPSLSLQVNIPVLSVSLGLLLVLLLGALAVLGFKRKIHRRFLKRGSLLTVEPRHIIYEIQTRRPVVENIYTLD